MPKSSIVAFGPSPSAPTTWTSSTACPKRLVGKSVASRRREAGVAQRVELGPVQFLERTAKRVKAKGLAFLEDKPGGLAPHFDDEWFGHLVSFRSFNAPYVGDDCGFAMKGAAEFVVCNEKLFLCRLLTAEIRVAD